ncbi:MAG: hypothetical protein AB2A00_06695 [Myxococcota bacterium]
MAARRKPAGKSRSTTRKQPARKNPPKRKAASRGARPGKAGKRAATSSSKVDRALKRAAKAIVELARALANETVHRDHVTALARALKLLGV